MSWYVVPVRAHRRSRTSDPDERLRARAVPDVPWRRHSRRRPRRVRCRRRTSRSIVRAIRTSAGRVDPEDWSCWTAREHGGRACDRTRRCQHCCRASRLQSVQTSPVMKEGNSVPAAERPSQSITSALALNARRSWYPTDTSVVPDGPPTMLGVADAMGTEGLALPLIRSMVSRVASRLQVLPSVTDCCTSRATVLR